MSNKLGILRKIWGKNKADHGDGPEPKPSNKNYFQITFDNHENPQNSFIIDNNNPQSVYYTGIRDGKNNPFYEELEREAIKESRKHKKAHKEKESNSERSVLEDPKNSIVLSQPRVYTWRNKDAYVYTVESKYNNDGERPDLEFVIYIPIDTAVKWLRSSIKKTPDYISELTSTEKNAEKAAIESPERERKYGSTEEENNRKYITFATKSEKSIASSDEDHKEEKNGQKPKKIKEEKAALKSPERGRKYGSTEEENNRKYTTFTWKNEENSASFDSNEDEEDNEGQKNNPKTKKIKEKKVRGPKKTTKKAGRIITTYEEDEDEISLGRLRPVNQKDPVKIVAANDKLY